MENGYIDAEFEPEKIELTRAEIDALNKHNEKVRREMLQAVFNDVEELLEANKKLEHNRAEMSQSYVGEQKHTYAEALCVTLLIDLQMLREKYEGDRG
jgi:dephospho-CoA kinase